MKKITWQGSVDLSREILLSPPGDWTHMIGREPVRYVKRVMNPSGQVQVFFRARDYAGTWLAHDWDREAKELCHCCGGLGVDEDAD